ASREVRGYDVILSSSSLFLKALRKKPGAVHIQYCHTPPRFLWTERDYASREVPKVLQFLAFPYLRWMKGWDVRMSNRVDIFIANSREVQKRIREFYGRDSVVVYPFVNTSFWKPTKPKGGYFLMAGRLVSHKRFELVVEAFNQLGLPLYVAGRGRIEGKLRSIAKSNIIFKGRVNDEELRDLYSGAIAYLYPQFEDAGIMPLEAAACGTPTIAADQGGSKETVLHGVTGMRVAEVSVLSLVQAVKEITSQAFEQEKMIRHAHGFSEEKFKEQLLHVVNVYL
ncbi:MAG TPA: glycosyltransferase, partial [Patescibacteria group bacterium]|nr:glycosyltransferase [Patescibacteria group bacterium]